MFDILYSRSIVIGLIFLEALETNQLKTQRGQTATIGIEIAIGIGIELQTEKTISIWMI